MNPEVESVYYVDAKRELDLSEEETILLSRLIYLGHFYRGSSTSGTNNWRYGVPDDIDILAESNDFREYIHEYILRDYDPNYPVNENEQFVYKSDQKQKYEIEFDFINDKHLRKILASDWTEAQLVHKANARKSCIILCGGILEGMLLDSLNQKEKEAKSKYKLIFNLKKAPQLFRWGLNELVSVAEELEILSQDSMHLSHVVRGYRNLIHPGLQLRKQMEISVEESNVAYNAVKICIRELGNSKV